MLQQPHTKYRAFTPVAIKERTWPDAILTTAPRWLSTDLRDGNQALAEPMDAARKLRMYELLLAMGFKEIEVGFPASSQIEFDFVRKLIEEDRVPPDVTIQVMTPAREEMISRTVQSLQGARRAIVHVYNAIAPVWRSVVFGMEVPQVMQLVQQRVSYLKQLTDAMPQTDWVLQYSPETFCMAELEVSLEACETAIAAWGAGREIILNLPTTVENTTPNVFADQIEWMARALHGKQNVTLSVHPHNDRGTGTAAAELALMAGAQRVEGCLFGNGERTGNLDLVNLALNFYVQGVHPGLDFSDIGAIRATVEHCTQMPVSARQPYAGDLVYTSFSGSHQDAIRKAFAVRQADDIWQIPYLPVDPKDLGCSYEAVIRVNSQSGKGGIAYLLESEYNLQLPRRLQIEFSQIVQSEMDLAGGEFSAQDLYAAFERTYQPTRQPIQDVRTCMQGEGVYLTCIWRGQTISGRGNGPMDALAHALEQAVHCSLRVLGYHEHAVASGSSAQAVAYVELRVNGRRTLFGVGIHHDITTAALAAIANGLERALADVTANTAKSETIVA